MRTGRELMFSGIIEELGSVGQMDRRPDSI